MFSYKDKFRPGRMISLGPMATDKLQASTLRQALRFAELSQAELVRLMRTSGESIACSESYMSKIANGLKPGPQYQAAINRALAKKGVSINWDSPRGQNY